MMFQESANNGTLEEKEKLTNGTVNGENGVNGVAPPPPVSTNIFLTNNFGIINNFWSSWNL